MSRPPTVFQPDEYATRESFQHKSPILLDDLNITVQQQMKLVVEFDKDGLGARTQECELVQIVEGATEPSVG